MTEIEIIEYVSGPTGVVTLTASEENLAPESAWGDTFFFYDPEGDRPENQRLPFATVVIHDYVGWDTESHLDRDGIFRVNIAIGSTGFERLLGYPPAEHQAHRDQFDYAATDVLIPIRCTPPKAGSRSSTRQNRRAPWSGTSSVKRMPLRYAGMREGWTPDKPERSKPGSRYKLDDFVHHRKPIAPMTRTSDQ